MSATQIFHTVGRRLVNQVFNGATARPTAVWLGLRQLDGASGHPADAAAADTMTSNLQEVSQTSTGYARVSMTLSSGAAPETLSGADSIITYPQQTFTFTATITGITHSFICTATTATDTTGVLIASGPLATTRNVANGDQIKVTFVQYATQG